MANRYLILEIKWKWWAIPLVALIFLKIGLLKYCVTIEQKGVTR